MNSAVYKLKQKYPSLPSNWEVGMEVSIGDYKYNFSPMNAKYIDKELPNVEVRNNPEYWEKVEELLYPIGTKFTCFESSIIYTISSLHKGIVTVSWENPLPGFTNYKINLVNKFLTGNWWKIYKEPEILVTTLDNVKLYEGDIVYGIHADNWTIFNGTLKKGNTFHTETWLYGKFSTKKAALNFIKCNKPVLNYNEVLELLDFYYPPTLSGRPYFKDKLTKLVKSKL